MTYQGPGKGRKRRRMAAVFAVVAIGGATGIGVRFAAAADDPAAAGAITVAGTLQHRGHPSTLPEDYVRIADAPDAGRHPPRPGRVPRQLRLAVRPQRRRPPQLRQLHRLPRRLQRRPPHARLRGQRVRRRQLDDESLAAAGTTCRRGDLSTYFWPVVRDIRRAGDDADQPGGGLDGNLGTIITPASVPLQFRGNAQAKVVAMPRFLRVITGDAKAVTNGPNAPNARAQWTCSGTRGKVSSTQYPICPRGQLVQRISDFPGCWDGANIDSTNHRTHTSFADPTTGACAEGTVAIPQLRITLSYRVPRGASYALDTFPEQLRKAVTDHNDFVNVMPDSLMRRAVACINSGRRC